jgi:hypothetical protein
MSKQEFSRLDVLLRVQSGGLRVTDACVLPDLNSGFRKDKSFQWLEIFERSLSTTPARLAAQAVG